MCINRFHTPPFPRRRESSHSNELLIQSNWIPACAGMTRQRGISLVELIMFIVIISIALAGILLVMNRVAGHSADTLLRKQALAIAESLLEEVELMPFTFCDPADANATTAASPAGCAVASNSEDTLPLGPRGTGLARYGPSYFNNVGNYNGFIMNSGNGGIKDITNSPITALNGYAASIIVAQQGIPIAGASLAISNADALLITVTVTAPDNSQVVLDGYRTRYAPNSLP